MFMKKVLLAAALLSATAITITTGSNLPYVENPATIISSAENLYDGECGYNAVYTVKNNKTLVIYGKGSKEAYIDDYSFVGDEFASIEYVVVKEEIQAIGIGAFNIPSLKKITISNENCEIKGTYGNYELSIVNPTAVICGYKKSTAKEFATVNNRAFCDIETDEYTYPSGECGENVSWKLKNGTLSVSGNGSMYDYDTDIYNDTSNSSPFYIRDNYNNNESLMYVNKIKVKDGVSSIGSKAFYHLYQTNSVELPESLEKIGDYAFVGLHSLPEITIPENVSYIGEGAFDECESLEKVTILSNNCEIAQNPNTLPANATIYGYNNSTAEQYAVLYNRNFVSLGDYYTEETEINININENSNQSSEVMAKSVEPIKKKTEKITESAVLSKNITTDTNTYSAVILGDVTGDKKIDSTDAVNVLKYYAQSLISKGAEIDKNSADVDKDGNVNSTDAVWILKYYAKTLIDKNIGSMENFVK